MPKYVQILGKVSAHSGTSKYISLSFPDFTRHFSSSLAETVDSVETAVLNQ